MTLRTLRYMTCSEGIPTPGWCSMCGHLFTTPADALADPQKAAWAFYNVFDRHKWVDEASARHC
jgi:hypothetical protein